jgi:hypothetical protein
MKKVFAVFFLLITVFSISAQESNKEFLNVADKIDRILQYDDISPKQLKSLLTDLEQLSEGNELLFNQIKIRVNYLLLPIEVKIINTAINNEDLVAAYPAINALKKVYGYNKEIDKLDRRLNSALFDRFKGIVMDDIQPRFTIEPTYSWFSSDYTLDELPAFTFNDFAPVYGFGFSYNFGIKQVYNSGNKYYTFSQLGVRSSMRNNTTIFFPDGGDITFVPERNTEAFILYRKTFGLSIGMYSKFDPADISLYNATGSFYIPMKGLSLGVHARVISNLDMDPVYQLGASAKLNFKCFKPFTKKHKNEVEIRIVKFKESNR